MKRFVNAIRNCGNCGRVHHVSQGKHNLPVWEWLGDMYCGLLCFEVRSTCINNRLVSAL